MSATVCAICRVRAVPSERSVCLNCFPETPERDKSFWMKVAEAKQEERDAALDQLRATRRELDFAAGRVKELESAPKCADPPDGEEGGVCFVLPKCPHCSMSRLSSMGAPIVRDPSHDGFREFYPIIVNYECRNCCHQFSVHFAALMICGMG